MESEECEEVMREERQGGGGGETMEREDADTIISSLLRVLVYSLET